MEGKSVALGAELGGPKADTIELHRTPPIALSALSAPGLALLSSGRLPLLARWLPPPPPAEWTGPWSDRSLSPWPIKLDVLP